MRKISLLFIATFISMSFQAQDFPKNQNGQIEFSEIIETPLKGNDLHSNAKEWTAKTFGDYKSVVQFEDNENFKLIIKGISNIAHIAGIPGMTTKEKISYTITIESKDGRYRYTIDNILANPTMTVLGTSMNIKSILPSDHKRNIEKYTNQLNDLKLIDETTFKKKALKEHKEKIADLENNILDEGRFYLQEYQAILGLVSSLKEAMESYSDF